MKGTALSKLDAALGPYRGFLPEQVHDAQCVAVDDPRLNEAPPRRRGDQTVRGAARDSVRRKIESG